jgi:hypothetical protein
MPAMLQDSLAGRRASLSLGDDQRWYVVRTLQLLPPEQLTKAARLFNGGFETAPSGSPFDWVFNGGSGVTIELDGHPEQAKGNALLVEFGPARVDFSGVTELVVLSPRNVPSQGELQVGRRQRTWLAMAHRLCRWDKPHRREPAGYRKRSDVAGVRCGLHRSDR